MRFQNVIFSILGVLSSHLLFANGPNSPSCAGILAAAQSSPRDKELLATQLFQMSDFAKMQKIGEGSESEVFRDGNNVFKVAEPYNQSETAGPRIKSILWADQVIGAGTLRLAGYWVGKNGVINPVFQQPFVSGREATPNEIKTYMQNKGFTPIVGSVTSFFKDTPEGRIIAYDLDGANVRVTENGSIAVIDASAYIK